MFGVYDISIGQGFMRIDESDKIFIKRAMGKTDVSTDLSYYTTMGHKPILMIENYFRYGSINGVQYKQYK
jgi:hypothetical protein